MNTAIMKAEEAESLYQAGKRHLSTLSDGPDRKLLASALNKLRNANVIEIEAEGEDS